MHATAEADTRRGADNTVSDSPTRSSDWRRHTDTVKADVGLLERHVDEQRLRLRSSAADLQRLVDDPAGLRISSMPQLSGATLSLMATETTPPVEEEDDVLVAAPEAEVVEPEPDLVPLDEEIADEGPPTRAVRVLDDEFAPVPVASTLPASAEAIAYDDTDDDVWETVSEEPGARPLGLFDSVAPGPQGDPR